VLAICNLKIYNRRERSYLRDLVIEVRRKVSCVVLVKLTFTRVHPRIRVLRIRIGRGSGAVCRAEPNDLLPPHARTEYGYSSNAVLIRKAIHNSVGHHKEIHRTKYEKRAR
jgi:hypothetical protein